MPVFFRRWYALAAMVALGATVASIVVWRSIGHAQLLLRAGSRNNSLSTSLNPEGRVDAMAVEVLAEAARRAGIHLQWVNCPEGPDGALRAKKVDLWPVSVVLPERK